MFMGILVFAALFIASGAFYTVDETQQVVVTQFGQPIGEPITVAGLKFKMPITQTANYFEKRILTWDGDPNQIPTKDKRYIWVDTTARWKIVDALKFMQSVGSEQGAQARLDDIIDSATRDTISNSNLVEAVRDSNRVVEIEKTRMEAEESEGFGQTVLDEITKGREELSRDILAAAQEIVPNYGIELIDVRIKRINYVKEVQLKVYERMISERRRAAEQFRSEGQGKKAAIEGNMTKELEQIQAEAYKTAEETKGKADAEAIKIYADAYNKDPEFYAFMQTLETYKSTINKDTNLILTTDNDFYRTLEGVGIK